MKAKLKLGLILVLSLLIFIIVLQNNQVTETRILFLTVKMPRAVLLFLTGAGGFTLGVLCSLFVSTTRR